MQRPEILPGDCDSGGSKETEDKAVVRRPMPHGGSLHEMCYSALKVLGRLVVLQRQQVTPNYLLCFALIKRK